MKTKSKEARQAELDRLKQRLEREAAVKLKRLGLPSASASEQEPPKPFLFHRLETDGWDFANPSAACLRLTQLPNIDPEFAADLDDLDKEGILWRILTFELDSYFSTGRPHKLIQEARRAAVIFILWRRGLQSRESYDSIDAESLWLQLEYWRTFRLSPSIRRLNRCEALCNRIQAGEATIRDRGVTQEETLEAFATRWRPTWALGYVAQEALFSRLHLYLDDPQLQAVMDAALRRYGDERILQGEFTARKLLVHLMFMGVLADDPGREIVVEGPDGGSKIRQWALLDALRSTYGDLRKRRVGREFVSGKAGADDVQVEDDAVAPDEVADAVDQRDQNDAYLAVLDGLDVIPGTPDAAYRDYLRALVTGDREPCPLSAFAEEQGFRESTMRGARQRLAEQLARRAGGTA